MLAVISESIKLVFVFHYLHVHDRQLIGFIVVDIFCAVFSYYILHFIRFFVGR